MLPNRFRESRESSSFQCVFRAALLFALMGVQGETASCKEPFDNWDNTDYLYQEMVPKEDPTPATPNINRDDSGGFDYLREKECTEDTCKLG